MLSAAPTSSETSSTCRISPRAKASTRVLGMMDKKNFTAVNWPPALEASVTAWLATRLAACRPTPGLNTFTTTMPTSMPTVDSTSK